MEHIWGNVISIAVAVTSSIISLVLSQRIKKREEEIAVREAEKEQYEYLCMESLNAITCICKELYNCEMLGRTANGELKEAFNYMQESKHRLEDFLRKLAAKK